MPDTGALHSLISDLPQRSGGATRRVFRRRAFGGRGSFCAVAGCRVFPVVLRREQAWRRPCLAQGCTAQVVFHPAGYTAPYLTVFSENAIDVFDVRKAEWVQTVPLKKVRACPDPGSALGRGGVAWHDLCACCLRCDP